MSAPPSRRWRTHGPDAPPLHSNTTRSAIASLETLDDTSALALREGDVLVWMNSNGLGPVTVRGVRESAWGPIENPQPCQVIDAVTLSGQQVAFAPSELMRVVVDAEVSV